MKIRKLIKLIEADGWYLVTMRGSHRQYKHPTKPGRVTIAGHPNHNLAPGTLGSILKQAQIKIKINNKINKMYRFLIIIEKAGKNYSAYSPDLPGCVATGETREEVEQNMYDAVEMHVEGLVDDNMKVPEPRAVAEYLVIKPVAEVS